MALILSGDTGVPASGMPTGSVIQTVQATYNTVTSTSSGTFVTTNLAATITPISSTSKIFVSYSIPVQSNTSSGIWTTIYRGATNLGISGGTIQGFGGANLNISGAVWAVAAASYLDSPATTSPVTYTIYFNNGGGANAVNAFAYNQTGLLTLQEIHG